MNDNNEKSDYKKPLSNNEIHADERNINDTLSPLPLRKMPREDTLKRQFSINRQGVLQSRGSLRDLFANKENTISNATTVLEEATNRYGNNERVIPGYKLQRNSSIVLRKNVKDISQRNNLITEEKYEVEVIERRKSNNYRFDLYLLPCAKSNFNMNADIDSCFTNLKHLTDGSNSNIFKARESETDRVVIIKLMKDSSHPSKVALAEFQQEILIISRMNHPHILDIYGCGEINSKLNENAMRPWIALEALDGNSLSYHLKLPRHFNEKPFTELRYIRIAKEFSDALSYLHDTFHSEYMLIHRDLKPDNIGFTSNGVLKIMDFGLCVCVKKNSTDDRLYKLTGNTGSKRYMAPEVGLAKPYNESVDMYSFGVILHHIITGISPFNEVNIEQFDEKVFHNNYRPSLQYDVYGRDINAMSDVKTFIEKCWDNEYLNRPTAKQGFELFSHLEISLIQKREELGCLNCIQDIFQKRDTI